MTISDVDRKILTALASTKEAHKELEPLINFYEAIYQAQFEAKARLGRDITIPTREVCCDRLRRGLIQLTFEQLRIETMRFVRLVRRMSYIILENSPGWELPLEPLNQVALTDIARQWFESGEPAVGSNGQSSTLVALSVCFALSPYLQRAAELLLPLLDQKEWQRNICPICGGKPGFATLSREDGSRNLFCPRCHSSWLYKRTICPFCQNEEGIVYYPSEDQVYRLYVCSRCKRYLKTIDLRRTDREPILPVERIVTVAMDLAAQQEGYLSC